MPYYNRPKCSICNYRPISGLSPELLRGDEKIMCMTCSLIVQQFRAMMEYAENRGVLRKNLLEHLGEKHA